LTLNADGSFSYPPAPDFDGEDSFTYTVSDGHGGTAIGTAKIGVADSEPVAASDSVTMSDTTSKTIDLVIVLDQSASMGDDPGVDGFSTRMELARSAIAGLFQAYQSVADVHIQIVNFASTAASSGWLSTPEAANAYLAGLTPGGGTNYSAAIDKTIASYVNVPTADTPGNTATEIYFLSDGNPTAGTSLADTGKVGTWENFLSSPANHIDKAFAVGIGSGIAPGDPDLADVAFPNGDPSNPLVLTDESQLLDTLTGTVANHTSGNVLTNDDFGADGKGNGGVGLLSIQVNGHTHTYDQAANQIHDETNALVAAGAVLAVHTGQGGDLVFHFDTGDYTYAAPEVTGAPIDESFTY